MQQVGILFDEDEDPGDDQHEDAQRDESGHKFQYARLLKRPRRLLLLRLHEQRELFVGRNNFLDVFFQLQG